jgi:phage baseplate assembly protein W
VIEIKNEDLVYSDLSSEPKVAKLVDVNSVEQSLDNILALNKGDIIFNEVGADLDKFLFRPLTEQTAFEIITYIVQEIHRFDPRINIIFNKSYMQPDYEHNAYIMILQIQIKGLENQELTYKRVLVRDGD